MLKKTTSIFLSIVLILSLCSATVFGVMPTTAFTCTTAGTIDATSTGTANDNFDDETITETQFKRYNRNGNQSDLFVDNESSYNTFRILSANNASDANDKMLEVSNRSAATTSNLKTLKFYVTENYVTELSYNVRFTSVPTSSTLGGSTAWSIFGTDTNGCIQIYLDSTDGKWKLRDRSTKKYSETIEANKLYTVRAILDGTTGNLQTYLLDGTTGAVLVCADRKVAGTAGYTADSAAQLTAIQLYKHVDGESEVTVEIDNAKMVRYNRTVTGPGIVSSTIANGATGINPATTNSIEVEFDQSISAVAAALKADGLDDVACRVSAVSNKLNTYTVSWEGELTANTTYTLDMSATTNGSITAGDDAKISFTTKAPLPAPVLSSSSIENGQTWVPITTNSVEVAFDSAVTVNATLTADDETVIETAVTPVTDKTNTYTISWSDELALGTTYTLDMSQTVNADAVQAGEAAIITFTTEKDIEKLTEDFESGTVNKSQFQGNILQLQYSSRDGEASFVDGYNGEALRIEVAAKDRGLALDPLVTKETYTPEVISAEGAEAIEYEKFIVTYRFNLKEMADVGTATVADTDEKGDATATTAGSRIHMAIDDSKSLSHQSLMARISTQNNKPFIQNPSNANYGAEFELDHWYNIVWLVDGADQTFKFIDAETGKLVWERIFTSETYTAGAPLYVIPYAGRRMSAGSADSGYYVYNEGQTALIDDFTIWRVNPKKDKQMLALTDSNDGAVLDIDSAENNKITLTYNQPILGTSTDFEVYKGTTKDELAYSTANIKFADFCTQEITFSNLDYSGEYLLDYSAMEAVSGAEIPEAAKPSSLVEFTTAAAPQMMSIVGDISCTGQAAGDTISFDLYSKEEQKATVVTAFYNRVGNLLGVQSQVENMTAGETKAVTATVAQTQYADYIKIFVWNDLEKCQPLSKKYDLHAPVDSLDVLLIGSSISEDAGRYLDEVAAADGFDLNVTVKGIGGSNFTHHAANLRAELAGRTVAQAKEQLAAGTVVKPLYWTYIDGVYQTSQSQTRLIDALNEKQYDVISLNQAAYHDPDVQEDITFIAETIRKYQPNAEIVFYQTWSHYDSSKADRNYYYTHSVEPQVVAWAAATGANAEGVIADKSPVKIFPAGKAFYLADNKYEWCGVRYSYDDGDTESEAKYDVTTKMLGSTGLWRDYNHASYYGCYLADAVWYEMLTGRKAAVGTEASPAVPMPDGITAAEHIERLEQLSDIAHQAVLEQK